MPISLSAIGYGKMAGYCGINGQNAAALSLHDQLKAFWPGSRFGAFVAAIKRAVRFLCSWG